MNLNRVFDVAQRNNYRGASFIRRPHVVIVSCDCELHRKEERCLVKDIRIIS